MSTVPSRAARAVVHGGAPTPAVAGFRHSALAVAAAFALQAAHGQSVPIGAVHGTATFQRDGNNLLVNTTNGAGNRSVINWQTFGVPGGSTTHFAQPDATSTSINRVTGGTRSDIFGTLSSNGRLVLVNPSGIAIGANGMVDTAGFTASTLFLSEADAIAGRRLYSGGGGTLSIAEGAQILARSGDVVLIGSKVQVGKNALVQSDGNTILAAGEKVEITGRGLEGIHMEVQAGNEAVNLGTLKGDAVGIFAGTLRHSGLAHAQAVTAEGGKVVLKSAGDTMVDGTVIASALGGKGGSIDVLGQRVGLLAGALLDASGARGGGQVRVGGDYQGRNPDVANAKAVFVDANARIVADATVNGNGGRVIVWSDELTRMRGTISARGGATGGDGGFAEISSKGYLDFTGFADLRAAMGQAGTLLLDPQDIVIFHTGSAPAPAASPYVNDYIAIANVDGGTDFTYTGGPSYIEDARVNLQLASSNLTITTSHDPARYPPPPSPPPISDSGTGGQVTVNTDAAISWNNSHKLEILADKGIQMDGSISGSDPGSSLSLLAKTGSIAMNGSMSAGTISLEAQGGTVVQAGSSIVTAANLQVNAKGKIDLQANNQVDALAANSTLGGANGDIFFRNARNLTIGTAAFGAFQGATAGSGNVDIRTTTAGSITVAAPPPPPTSGPAPAPATVVSGSNVTLVAADSVILNGNVKATSLATFRATAGSISQHTASVVNAGALILDAQAGAINLPGANLVSSLAGRSGGGFTFNNAQALTIQQLYDLDDNSFSGIDAGGSVSVTVASGNLSLASPATVTGRDVTLQTTGAAGDILLDGNVTGRGGVTLTSAGGSIQFATIDASGEEAGSSRLVDAGNVTLRAKGSISGASISANGGSYYDGESGDAAGNGGVVDVISDNGAISISNIRARAGFFDGFIEHGAAAGKVKLTTQSLSGGAGGITAGVIDVQGGTGGTGTAGGEVTLLATNGNVSLEQVYANGGSSTGSDGAAGGDGGKVSVTASGDIAISHLEAIGGNSATGAGGQGGEIHLKTGGSLTFFAGETGSDSAALVSGTGAYAHGGNGGSQDAGNGMRGGKGGTIEVAKTNGDMVADRTWVLSAVGGAGGGATTSGGVGGQGGDGGDVSVSATGRLQLASPVIDARGGAGGSNGDESASTSGVNGTFRASGTSVDVTSNFALQADWINDSIVKVMGTSQVSGQGFFQNNGEVQLFDTAVLNAGFGVANAGRFTSFGSATQANLTLNTSTGVVDVVAGSTLSTPVFLVNRGRVQVDGTLRIADTTLLSEVPTSGPLFTNEATGTLSGNGSIVVSRGLGTVQNFGTIAPGGEGVIGALTLDANLLMEAGSTLAADLLNTGSHDNLVVTGSATTGGSVAANYLPGTTFATGDSFRVLQSGGLDASTLPPVDKPQLQSQASGNDLLLVATAGFPATTPPASAPPNPGADQENALQQSNNQVTTFADLFVKMSEDQDKKRIGKDDIVITDTACTR